MDSYRRDGIMPTETAGTYAASQGAMPTDGYAHVLRDVDGRVVFRTNDAELARRYARALARQTLVTARDAHQASRVETLARKFLGIG